jgi:hypothetical protein
MQADKGQESEGGAMIETAKIDKAGLGRVPRKGYIRREMEKRLKRSGVHPNDIKKACDFIENAARRDEAAAQTVTQSKTPLSSE